jgi:hypothetical protein
MMAVKWIFNLLFQLKSLRSKIDDKDIALRDVHVMLQKTEEKLHATDKHLGLCSVSRL